MVKVPAVNVDITDDGTAAFVKKLMNTYPKAEV